MIYCISKTYQTWAEQKRVKPEPFSLKPSLVSFYGLVYDMYDNHQQNAHCSRIKYTDGRIFSLKNIESTKTQGGCLAIILMISQVDITLCMFCGLLFSISLSFHLSIQLETTMLVYRKTI